MSRTVIVTGAAGFIGSHLGAALLARGDRVIGIDNFDPFYDRAIKLANLAPLASERFELAETDIRDRQAIKALLGRWKPDALFHIAALAGVRPSIAEPGRYASAMHSIRRWPTSCSAGRPKKSCAAPAANAITPSRSSSIRVSAMQKAKARNRSRSSRSRNPADASSDASATGSAITPTRAGLDSGGARRPAP